MEPLYRPVDTPPRPAATVVLLRDGDRGPEVLLLRRHDSSAVLGGVHVFPGGKLDDADSADVSIAHAGASPEALRERLGEPGLDARLAAGFFVAACRETFEEASVLLARGADARVVDRAGRRAREGLAFDALLAEFGLQIASDALVPFTRWITPKVPAMMNRRFDVRFFVAALPAGQQARHDDHEATDSVWLTPRAAIERYRRREIVLAPAQIMSLAQIGRHASVADVLDEVRRRAPPVVEPESFEAGGVRTAVYPGDERHSVRARAMPGPTRLVVHDGRFEPPGGFDAFFD
ncbi:MAG: NUDIX hydrolase [Burkholderiaceae bacterium]|nr:NUDIX hydrolase [Burkholderiaceae bacterium]MEB2351998.1 NUDIX hydrolase [Burkholderiaceae bacterium]